MWWFTNSILFIWCLAIYVSYQQNMPIVLKKCTLQIFLCRDMNACLYTFYQIWYFCSYNISKNKKKCYVYFLNISIHPTFTWEQQSKVELVIDRITMHDWLSLCSFILMLVAIVIVCYAQWLVDVTDDLTIGRVPVPKSRL